MGFMKELAQVFGMGDGDTSRDIRGWTVLDADGLQVGRVEDLIYDERSHELRYARVALEGRTVLVPIGEL